MHCVQRCSQKHPHMPARLGVGGWVYQLVCQQQRMLLSACVGLAALERGLECARHPSAGLEYGPGVVQPPVMRRRLATTMPAAAASVSLQIAQPYLLEYACCSVRSRGWQSVNWVSAMQPGWRLGGWVECCWLCWLPCVCLSGALCFQTILPCQRHSILHLNGLLRQEEKKSTVR
jgi:hypothetical protein